MYFIGRYDKCQVVSKNITCTQNVLLCRCYAVTALLTMLDSSRIQNMQPALFVVNSHVRISINKPSDLVLRKDRKKK